MIGLRDSRVLVKDLEVNPIILTNSSTVVRVKHIDHGMYSTSNNVEIRNVSSGLSTTLCTRKWNDYKYCCP